MELHTELGEALTEGGFSYKEVEGCYKRMHELSYLIIDDRPLTLPRVLKLAATFEQEAVFTVDKDNKAELIETLHPSARHQLAGTFQQITEADAKELDSWTRDGPNYWGVI
jgi:hypothetical protein